MLKQKSVLILATTALIVSFIFLNRDYSVKVKTYYAMGTSLKISIAEEKLDMNIFPFLYNNFKEVETIFKENPDIKNTQVMKLFLYAKHLQKQTGGVFSPFLGDVIKLWQFDRTTKTITSAPTNEQIEQALKSKSLNLYAIAKGYGIDTLAKLLKVNNINNFIINAGGDVYVSGTKYGKPWVIGVSDTNNNTLLKISCNLDSYAVATSSNLYNYYTFDDKKYGHLINGVTGKPTNAEKSVTVISKNATAADGLATAHFIDSDLKNRYIDKYTEVIEISSDNKINQTNNIKNCKIEKTNV